MSVKLVLPERRTPWTSGDAEQLAEQLAGQMVERTRQGLDVDGQPFPRREDGSPSTLEESGELLDGIYGVGDGERAVIVSSAEHSSHLADGGRRFLGLTPAEQRALQRRLHRQIGERLAGRE